MFENPICFTQKRVCKACGLYLNQLPVFDKKKKSGVFWVGLSSVFISSDEDKLPLSPHTRTGALVKQVEDFFSEEVSFYKTNIVKCLPLEGNKIRYPKKSEMEKCYPNLQDEIKALKPKIIFLLGKQVASFVLEKFGDTCSSLNEDFSYKVFRINGIMFIPIHHPSFILVYKRKFIYDYIESLCSIIDSHVLEESLCRI